MSSPHARHASPTPQAADMRARIVATALELIKSDGLDAFSTRKLAARLGLKAMSLYHYYPSREALLDAAVDRMIAEVPLPDVSRAEWRMGLLRTARAYRAMGRRHLNAAPLLAQRCPASPTMQSFLDTLSGLLKKAGLGEAAAADWLIIQRDYVIGSLLAEHAAAALAREPAAPGEDASADRLARRRPNMGQAARDRAFEKGFRALLNAVEQEQRSGRSVSSP